MCTGPVNQIRPVWVGDLGTRPRNPTMGWFRPENRQFVLFSAAGVKKDFQKLHFFSAVGYNTKDF
jgi:hypothetical protein